MKKEKKQYQTYFREKGKKRWFKSGNKPYTKKEATKTQKWFQTPKHMKETYETKIKKVR